MELLRLKQITYRTIRSTVGDYKQKTCLSRHDTVLLHLFLVSHFNFLFIPCGRLSWLPVSFLLHAKYPLSYRIVGHTRLTHSFLLSGDDLPECGTG